MKEYRLAAWPELDAPYNKTSHRRMLNEMSLRHMSIAQLAQSSGLRRREVRRFIAVLAAQQLLDQRRAVRPGPLRRTLDLLGLMAQVGWQLCGHSRLGRCAAGALRSAWHKGVPARWRRLRNAAAPGP